MNIMYNRGWTVREKRRKNCFVRPAINIDLPIDWFYTPILHYQWNMYIYEPYPRFKVEGRHNCKKGKITSASIGKWKCNFSDLPRKLWNRPTNMRVHREVTLPITISSAIRGLRCEQAMNEEWPDKVICRGRFAIRVQKSIWYPFLMKLTRILRAQFVSSILSIQSFGLHRVEFN